MIKLAITVAAFVMLVLGCKQRSDSAVLADQPPADSSADEEQAYWEFVRELQALLTDFSPPGDAFALAADYRETVQTAIKEDPLGYFSRKTTAIDTHLKFITHELQDPQSAYHKKVEADQTPEQIQTQRAVEADVLAALDAARFTTKQTQTLVSKPTVQKLTKFKYLLRGPLLEELTDAAIQLDQIDLELQALEVAIVAGEMVSKASLSWAAFTKPKP